MSIKQLILVLPALAIFACSAAAQDQTRQNQPQHDQPQQDQPNKIEHVPLKPTSSASGKEMFASYCAVCHGIDGKGTGPAASALKTAPADLTQLSKNNGGKYPALKVSSAIRGTNDLPAHGSKEMPVWGPLFWGLSNGHEGEVQQRVSNLTQYVETLQAK